MDMARKYAKKNVNQSSVNRIAQHFRAQPIVVHRGPMDMVGLELLNRSPLNFNDSAEMLAVDLKALECASILTREYRNEVRVHINAEVTSFLDTQWYETMVGVMCPGMVIEIVERNQLLRCASRLHRAQIIAHAVRRFGGRVALDDLSCTDLELDIVHAIQPEFVKLETVNRIESVRTFTGARVIVERIESKRQGVTALAMGADELQGYWCDVSTESMVPAAFTPPGVMARNEERSLAVA